MIPAGRALLVAMVAAAPAFAVTEMRMPDAAADEFHFAVLGDSQFHQPATFNRMIDDLVLLRPAFVVQVGDMIDGYSSDIDRVQREWRRFKRQIGPLGDIAFMPVPGNHDLYNAQKKSDERLVDLYRREWGAPFYAFDYRNARFIVLNSDAPAEEETIGDRQMAWLRETLAGTRAEHVFVFMHRPPLLLENADALHALLREYPVRYVFYGHHHHYHFEPKDGIGYVMTNAAADSAHAEERVGGFHHFLLVTVRDAEVGFAAIKADAVLPPDYVRARDNYDLFAIGRRLVPEAVTLGAARRASSRTAHAFEIPLVNPTDRELTLYVTCSSADDRWRFEPAGVAPVALGARQSRQVELTAWFDPDRVPESEPSCRLRLPFQTAGGHWLDYERTVTGTRPR